MPINTAVTTVTRLWFNCVQLPFDSDSSSTLFLGSAKVPALANDFVLCRLDDVIASLTQRLFY